MSSHLDERDARIACCTADHLLFGTSVQTTLAEVERQAAGQPGLAAYLARHPPPSAPKHPVSDFLALLYDGARLLAPVLPPDADPIASLGLAVAERFNRSEASAKARQWAEGKNPIELMANAPAVYQGRFTRGIRVYSRLSASECVLTIKDDPLPPSYYVGTLQGALTINGHECRLTGVSQSLTACEVHAWWDGLPPRHLR
jgi:uncharacterized protein (TIGR02265 family)